MKTLTLDDIVECSQDLEVIYKPRLPVAGRYCPDLMEVHYNPNRIKDQHEFILTLLHEFVHHKDIYGKLDESQTEVMAERLIRNHYILSYMTENYRCFILAHW
jgi:hypothetical protein